jgi:hypothetical protein
MSGINTGKVLTGGLVAAVVFFLIDAVSFGVLLKEPYDANLVRLGLDPAVMSGTTAIIGWVISELVFGILVVFVYAAIRPRFGPGPKTAIYAGLIPYIAVFLVMFGQAQGGLMPMSLFWQSSVLALVSICAGSIAGAWMYKEA